MREMRILRAVNMVDDTFLDEMNDIEEKQSHNKGRITTFIIIAALVSLLGLTVFASEYILSIDYWFYSFFADEPQSKVTGVLSENQQEILNRGLVAINQSVTDNGWTITLESGISDGYRMFVKYRIDAPDDIILNADNYETEDTTDIHTPKGEEDNFSAGYYSGETLEDDDPNDNSVSKLIEYILLPPAGSDFSITDGTVWTITFHNIKEENGGGEDFTQTILCEGNWEFKVVFTDDLLVTKSEELLEKPIYCSATKWSRNKKIHMKAKVTSFELRTLTATVRYRRPITALLEGVILDPIYVVMNDGTRVEAHFKIGLNRRNYEECIMTFDRPVSVDDVAYIDFPYAGEVSVTSE